MRFISATEGIFVYTIRGLTVHTWRQIGGNDAHKKTSIPNLPFRSKLVTKQCRRWDAHPASEISCFSPECNLGHAGAREQTQSKDRARRSLQKHVLLHAERGVFRFSLFCINQVLKKPQTGNKRAGLHTSLVWSGYTEH